MMMLIALPIANAFAGSDRDATPVGVWTAFNGNDGSLRALIEIRESKGILSGKIIKPYPLPGEAMTCEMCTGNLKGAPIQNFPIMANVKRDGDCWDGGQIIDPNTGDIYSVRLTLIENGSKLLVRGFLGFSLFGKSQVWVRKVD